MKHWPINPNLSNFSAFWRKCGFYIISRGLILKILEEGMSTSSLQHLKRDKLRQQWSNLYVGKNKKKPKQQNHHPQKRTDIQMIKNVISASQCFCRKQVKYKLNICLWCHHKFSWHRKICRSNAVSILCLIKYYIIVLIKKKKCKNGIDVGNVNWIKMDFHQNRCELQ